MADYITYGQKRYLKSILGAVSYKYKFDRESAARTIGCKLPIDNLTKQEAASSIQKGLAVLEGVRKHLATPGYSVADFWIAEKGRR